MHMADYIGETTSYDKKLMLERKDPTSWLKSVSAFANTQGGRLLFGMANDGSLVGLADAQSDAEFISETIKMQMDPVPEIDLSLHEEDGKRFVVVEIKAGTETPYYTFVKGHRDAFIRIGNESVRADATQLKRRGSGFGKILDAYHDASERIGKHVVPSFVSDPSGFVVTLPNLHYAASHGAVASFAGAKKRSAKSSAKRGVESSAKSGAKSSAIRRRKAAGKNENIIFRAIRDNSHVSIAELQRKTRLSNGGVRKIISALKSKGKIVRVGGTHGGYWEVVK